MHRYVILIEPAGTGYSAYSPDLPGCISTGATPADVEANMREAIAFHLDGLKKDGQAIPTPHTVAAYVEVAA